MKKTKIIYYLSTIGLSVFMLVSAFVELSRAQAAQDLFIHLGYPVYLLSILGVAKILGVIGIWQNKVKFLREWAYAGLFIDVSGAFVSYLFVGDGPLMYGLSIVIMIVIIISYISFKKLNQIS